MISVDALPWPDPEDVETCDPYPGEFVSPDDLPSSGLVVMDFSAHMIPRGVDERVIVRVLSTDDGDIDTAAIGVVSVTGGDDRRVCETIAVVDGQGEGICRFDEIGTIALTAGFTAVDGETLFGDRTVIVFETQLPVWEMRIDASDYDEIMRSPGEEIYVPAELVAAGRGYGTEVRIHGGSSRSYPKKSFRFDLDKGLKLPDTHDHIILRAEWNDKSLLRNYLGLALFRNGTWLPTPSAEMVHFRVNERYYGVMWHVERIGGDFLRLRGMNNETCSMYEADPAPACWIPGGDLSPLSDIQQYQCVYDLKKGDPTYADLIDFIEHTLQLDDDEFGKVIGDVLDVDAYFAYLAAMSVIGNLDHIKKNYYLYRDPEAADDRWIFFPWDLELTFGHRWTEENDVLDEGIFFDMSPEYVEYRNRLIDKLFVHPRFLVRYYDILDHILEHTFTMAFFKPRIERAVCAGAPDIWADTQKRATNEEYQERVTELYSYIENRRRFLL